MKRPNILIAVPAYGGSIKTKSAESLIALSQAFAKHNIGFNLSTTNRGDTVFVRNVFASMVVAETKYSHLLMVDYDMSFQSRGILKMLSANKPIIGWASPMRKLPITFNIKNPERQIENGLCQVDAVGTGIMLIERTALLQLQQTGQLRRQTKHSYQSNGFDGDLHGFFDCIDRDGERMTEDISFCERWRALCNGKIFALVDEQIGHIGEFIYQGQFSETVK